MTTPHNVYVVTTGEYSAYTIHSVWATGKEAEAYAERLVDSWKVWQSLDPSLDGEAKIAAYRTAVIS